MKTLDEIKINGLKLFASSFKMVNAQQGLQSNVNWPRMAKLNNQTNPKGLSIEAHCSNHKWSIQYNTGHSSLDSKLQN